MDGVHEGDVVLGVPVQAVAVHVEGDGVDQSVDGGNNLLAILPGGAVDDCQAARYEVVLDIHDDQGGSRADDLLDPTIPAEHKLLLAHTAVSGHVEDHEQIADHLGVHPRQRISLLPAANYY